MKIFLSIAISNLLKAQFCSKNNQCPESAKCCSTSGFCGSTLAYCGVECKDEGSLGNKCPPLSNGSNALSSCQPFEVDFANGASSKFEVSGPYDYYKNKLRLKFIKTNDSKENGSIYKGLGGYVHSNFTLGYGELIVRMSSARIQGIVTALTLISRERDEIDWEIVGRDISTPYTNYFYKGKLDFSKGKPFKVDYDLHKELHDFGVKYTKDYIQWSIDGNILRTLYKEDTDFKDGKYQYPESRLFLTFSLWDGAFGAQGTRDWAGGPIDFQDSEFNNNGNFMYSYIQSMKFKC